MPIALGTREQILVCFIFLFTYKNQEWNIQEKNGRETKKKYLGCIGWGEGDLAAREKPSFCVLLQELLMYFHLKPLCKIQAHTHTLFFHCLTFVKICI